MNMEEIAARITRLELRADVLTATVHTLLPAIPQTSHASVLERFGKYYLATERRMFSEDWPSQEFDMMRAALDEMQKTLTQALELSDQQLQQPPLR